MSYNDDLIPVPRRVLSYAMTALEVSSDRSDQYVAGQLRELLAASDAEHDPARRVVIADESPGALRLVRRLVRRS